MSKIRDAVMQRRHPTDLVMVFSAMADGFSFDTIFCTVKRRLIKYAWDCMAGSDVTALKG